MVFGPPCIPFIKELFAHFIGTYLRCYLASLQSEGLAVLPIGGASDVRGSREMGNELLYSQTVSIQTPENERKRLQWHAF